MQIDLDTLPDDPATLHQMLREVVTTAAHQQGELHAENDKLRLLIQRLNWDLIWDQLIREIW